ncbi:MAG: precorrin-6A synthase (deacetylating) [Caldimicrobium sp.]
MIKRLYLIGIGPGDYKYLTVEAKELIEKLSLFFVPEKGGTKEDLTKMRLELLKRIKGERNNYKVIFLPFPERERGLNYREKVKLWRKEKAKILKNFLLETEGKEAGFLILGDPALYDGHIEIMKEIEKEIPLEWEVIPGLSSFQVLTAKSKLSLTEVATQVTFHTPRTLRKLEKIDHPVVVFLDNYETFKKFKDSESDLQMIWGAYVGTPYEIIKKGPLKELVDEILSIRQELKIKKGYIMEVYILKSKSNKDNSKKDEN